MIAFNFLVWDRQREIIMIFSIFMKHIITTGANWNKGRMENPGGWRALNDSQTLLLFTIAFVIVDEIMIFNKGLLILIRHEKRELSPVCTPFIGIPFSSFPDTLGSIC